MWQKTAGLPLKCFEIDLQRFRGGKINFSQTTHVTYKKSLFFVPIDANIKSNEFPEILGIKYCIFIVINFIIEYILFDENNI